MTIVDAIEEELGDGVYKLGTQVLKMPDHYELFDGDSGYYSMSFDQIRAENRGAIGAFANAVIAYRPNSEEPFEILGWDVVWWFRLPRQTRLKSF